MAHQHRFTIVSLLALSVAMPAFAQEASEQPADTGAGARDVIVITANKREETVQDVAVAVTAISSENKQELGIITVTDLTNVTPGLSYTPGNERVTLRGIGRLTNSFGADPGVANYNDGLYTPFAVMAGKDAQLIQRVEVLRGPQGTLYGRNAIGGAINTISKRPTDDLSVDLKIGAGNYGYTNVVGAVSGPITDSVRYRVAAQREQRDGIDFNYGTGEKQGWEIDDYYYEGQLEGEIGDRFTWWLKVADSGYDKAGPPGGATATFSSAPVPAELQPVGRRRPQPGLRLQQPVGDRLHADRHAHGQPVRDERRARLQHELRRHRASSTSMTKRSSRPSIRPTGSTSSTSAATPSTTTNSSATATARRSSRSRTTRSTARSLPVRARRSAPTR